MKRSSKAIAGFALWAWLGGCGGGTLGGNGGMIGTVSGAAGVSGPGSGRAAAGGGVVVGSAGFGGDIAPPLGGRGGAGGRSGMCPTVAPPVCGALCGNRRIDSCRPPAGGACPVETESCDGDDFGSDSCAAYGYSSGKLTCRADCSLDLSACSYCVPSATVQSCGPSEISLGQRQLGWIALGATDTELAVAAVAYSPIDGSASVSLARLTSGLALESNVTLDDNSRPGPLYAADIGGTAVASIPSGWVVAVCGYPEIYVHAVDGTTGVDLGRTVVSTPSTSSQLCSTGKPVLAQRPGGGPLMLWQTDDGLSMSMIAADGLSASPPRTIVNAPFAIGAEAVSAAWVGGEFSVALTIEPMPGLGVRAIRLLRVLPDGSPSFVGDFWSAEVLGAVRVVTGASEVRVLFDGVVSPELGGGDLGIIWHRRAPDGLSPPPVMLARDLDYFGDAPAVAFGDDTLVLMASPYLTALAVTRVAADGDIVTPPYQIAAGLYGVAGGYDMVRRGPEAVVGWWSLDQIFLARVSL